MKKFFLMSLCLSIGFFSLLGCGPSQEEIRAKEKARQDSLAKVETQRLAKIEADRAAQAEAERIAAENAERERRRIEFDNNGRFTVQVEASRSEEKAEKLLPTWKKRGFPDAYIVKFGDEDSGEVWFRVRLGRFATRAMADKAASLVFEDFHAKTWVTNF